ncbi:hypothetical protein F5B20DRAFT_592890 [Whalleya microplaca]|nr:hypothetical protein F5B20DRAFT_592890 [Whalleya microplaca]
MTVTSSVYQNAFDDDCMWDGGNVVPWGPSNIVAQQVTTKPVAHLDYDSFSVKSTDQKTITNVQTISMDVILDDRCSTDETDLATANSPSEGTFPFMDLPLEIRLQVYRWLYLMNPIKLFHVGPWYPAPIQSVYPLRAVTADMGIEPPSHAASIMESKTRTPGTTTGTSKHLSPAKPAPLLSPYRPCCAIPAALLRANKQVYHECRRIPFHDNEFVFMSWFTSGLWAAHSLLKGLEGWQVGNMRYVRLELLSRDLSSLYASEWRELCAGWALGLRGLRLKIMSGGAYGNLVVAGEARTVARTVGVRDAEGAPAGWVENGLGLLRQLRWLEVELLFSGWDDAMKVEWCRCLEGTLNEARADAEARVRVTCVEKEAKR